jgi:hypothetical protein
MADGLFTSVQLLCNRSVTFAGCRKCSKSDVFFNVPSYQPQASGVCSSLLFLDKVHMRVDRVNGASQFYCYFDTSSPGLLHLLNFPVVGLRPRAPDGLFSDI